MTQEDLEDALDDLAHDLGKYIHLPLSFLPPDATDDEVHNAAIIALNHTRRGPSGNQSARELWSDFCREVGNALADYSSWSNLERVVEKALSWTERTAGPFQPEFRDQLIEDLMAVAPAIRRLRGQIDGGTT